MPVGKNTSSTRDLTEPNPSHPPSPLHVVLVTTTMIPDRDSDVAIQFVATQFDAITNGTTNSTSQYMEAEVVSDDLGIVASSSLSTRCQQYRGNHHETGYQPYHSSSGMNGTSCEADSLGQDHNDFINGVFLTDRCRQLQFGSSWSCKQCSLYYIYI